MLQPVANRLANLRNFQRMGKAGTVKIVLSAPKDLGFALQPAKRRSMQNPVAIDLKRRAKIIRSVVTGSSRGIKGLVKTVLHAGG